MLWKWSAGGVPGPSHAHRADAYGKFRRARALIMANKVDHGRLLTVHTGEYIDSHGLGSLMYDAARSITQRGQRDGCL
jgi:hypothetical protein